MSNPILDALGAGADNFYLAGKGDNIQKLRGAFSRLEPRLRALNSVGWNVWYAVNEFVPGAPAKSAEYVSHYRAHFADVDVPGAPPPAGLPKPSFVVESSPGKRQYLWLLPHPTPVYSYPEWAAIQAWITSQVPSADPAVKSSAQVLRLPGFVNCNYPDRPTVRILAEHDVSYSPADWLAIAPPLQPTPTQSHTQSGGAVRLTQFLARSPAPKPRSGLRNPWVFRLAAWGVRDLGLDPDVVAELLHDKLEAEQGHAAYEYEKVLSIVRNAARFGGATRRFTFKPDAEVGP